MIPLPFAFFLDAEVGFESTNVLPEPKFRAIDRWLEKSLEENHNAALAYRLTPYTQYPGDYYFFRKQLNPAQSRQAVLTQLGELVCNPRQRDYFRDHPSRFAMAVESLERWWDNREMADLDDAVSGLEGLAGVVPLADATAILRQLAEGPGDQSLEAFSENLRLRMSPMAIFRGLTLDYLWSRRAQAFLQLRVQKWLDRLG